MDDTVFGGGGVQEEEEAGSSRILKKRYRRSSFIRNVKKVAAREFTRPMSCIVLHSCVGTRAPNALLYCVERTQLPWLFLLFFP
jgi:hypothetical protein